MDTHPPSSTLHDKLNAQQRAAATYGHGPLLIIAGAGTGKTNTLAHRVAHLIETGTDPSCILLLTFSRRAAAEMMRRVDGLLATREHRISRGAITAQLWGGTFHAIAHRLIRIYGNALGLGESFTVLDRSDAEDLLNTVRSDLAFDQASVRFPQKGTCLSIYSRCMNAQLPIETVVQKFFPWVGVAIEPLKALFKQYTLKKQEQNTLDYDDLLLYWYHLMQDDSLAADVRERFDAVLVDEYQDTNALQAEILRRLRPDGSGLTVVGDDAQSIYSFRAATVTNILDYPTTFPGAAVLKLEQNYRSVQPILSATNAVIAQSPRRYEKELFSQRTSDQKPRLVTLQDETQQSQHVTTQILQHLEAGIALKKQAVLFRASHHSDALEVELARRNIPFVKFGGLKFLEAAHVKDAISILRLAENPRDSVSAFRVLQLLDGIGPAAAKRAIDHLISVRFVLADWATWPPPPAAATQWEEMTELLAQLAPNTMPLPEQIAAINRFYGPILERRFDEAQVRRRDLDQLEQLSTNFRTRSQLLADLTLDPPASTQDLAGPPLLDEDYLILSTIHSAKGCEWDCVYVLHAADGNIPSDMSTGDAESIEEERRLFYVALTRAKDFLEVCVPQRYYHRKGPNTDRHSFAQVTRFLPEAILDRFERITVGTPVSADKLSSAKPVVDVRGRIAGMWS